MSQPLVGVSLPPEKARAALLGLLIGDAVGVPYEFRRAHELPVRALIDMHPPAWFARSHPAVPAGTWSDDGALALALLDSLRHDPSLDLEHFAANMLAWLDKGRFTPDGRVFDIGIQTRASLQRWRRGVPAHQCGGTDEMDNGNGSLMRVLPCVMMPVTDEAALVQRALRQGLPTHAHPRSTVVCALYTLVAWHISYHGQEPVEALNQTLEKLPTLVGPAERAELDTVLQHGNKELRGSGYVVDCFWAAWHSLMATSSFADCIRAAVSLGDDTDTTACVAGGLAGLLYGEAGIPAAWREGLRGKELALGLLPGT